jgi:uncharacterized protein (TIGR02246 family)
MHSYEQAISQLVTTWLSATKTGDTEQVLKLMSDDVVFLTPGRPPMRKSDFVASQAAQQNFDIQGDSEIQEIKLPGDEWAYCWNKLSVVITPREGGHRSSGPVTLSPFFTSRLDRGSLRATPIC